MKKAAEIEKDSKRMGGTFNNGIIDIGNLDPSTNSDFFSFNY
jgi:hypothetical protein